MIPAITQSNPQFKARFYSHDLSVLINEAKRSVDPEKAMNQLSGLVKGMEQLSQRCAKLEYNSAYPDRRYILIIDGKRAAFSPSSFTGALKEFCEKHSLLAQISKLFKNKDEAEAVVRSYHLEA